MTRRWLVSALVGGVLLTPQVVGAGALCDAIAPADAPAVVRAAVVRASGVRAPETDARQAPRACEPTPDLVARDAPRCVVAADARGDDASAGASPQAGSDLAALLLGASQDAIVAELQVSHGSPARPPAAARPQGSPRAPADPPPADPPGDGEPVAARWEVTWEHPAEDGAPYVLFAERTPDEARFGYRLPDGTVGAAAGSVGHGRVRIVAPRAPFRVPDGTRVASIIARSGPAGAPADEIPNAATEHGSDLSFVVGRSCAAREIASCPVVVDQRGDAIPETDARDRVGSGPLDIVAVGASSDPETMTLSVRLADADDPALGGRGWTVSWTSNGTRWIAQADRTPRAEFFRYGRALGSERPAGPRFGGRAARGSIEGSLVSIEVPRSAVGVPPDGGSIAGVGAVSWVQAGEHTAAAFHVADRTRARPYRAGVSCGA